MFSLRFLIFACVAINLAYTVLGEEIESDEPTFDIADDWNLVPDADGKLQLLHRSQLHIPLAERFYNAERDIRFLLFTRRNPTTPQVFQFGSSLAGSHFNANHPTRFTIHGWRGSPTSNVNVGVRQEGLNVGEFNYIVVDWSVGAGTVNYYGARNRVAPTARVLAQWIDQLVRSGTLNLSRVSIIGHSLGAHLAGITGKNVQSGRLPVVIGLDPAGSMFYYRRPDDRLNSPDANYVEVIHTAGGIVGFFDPIGDADFYPNGGRSQPGCGLDVSGSCAHARSHEFFAESLTSAAGFWAMPCPSLNDIGRRCTQSGPLVRMGGEPSNRDNARGIYYLTTNNRSPFAQGR
jgi:pimeloyl-ACP methyl ester carboxylesterase